MRHAAVCSYHSHGMNITLTKCSYINGTENEMNESNHMFSACAKLLQPGTAGTTHLGKRSRVRRKCKHTCALFRLQPVAYRDQWQKGDAVCRVFTGDESDESRPYLGGEALGKCQLTGAWKTASSRAADTWKKLNGATRWGQGRAAHRWLFQ